MSAPDTHTAAPDARLGDLCASQPALRLLLDAGGTLATLAAPQRDLLDLGSDLREIGASLGLLADGLGKAYVKSGDCRTKHELAAFEAAERAAALRTAKRTLIDLAAWVGAVELAGGKKEAA